MSHTKILQVGEASPVDGGVVALDPVRVLQGRLLIQANSGGGKSYTMRSILEQIRDVPQIIFDLEGEYHTLATDFPYMVIGGDHGLFDVDGADKIDQTLHRIIQNGVSVVIDLYNHNRHKRQMIVSCWLRALMHLPREMWRPYLIVLDEAHVLAPEKGHGVSCCLEDVATLVTQGRKRGFGTILATQRISKLSKDVAAEFASTLIGRTNLDVDVKRACDAAGFVYNNESRKRLRSLSPGEFFAIGSAFSDDCAPLVKVPPVTTRHPQPGEIDNVVRVPAELGDYAVLFEDIFKEEGEAETATESDAKTILEQEFDRVSRELAEAKDKIAELYYELSKVSLNIEREPEKIIVVPPAANPTTEVVQDTPAVEFSDWIEQVIAVMPESTTLEEVMGITKLGQRKAIEAIRTLKVAGLVEYGANRVIRKTPAGVAHSEA